MFFVGAGYAWSEGANGEDDAAEEEASGHGVVVTAFVVIFIAEWGDLTQILTANLAAHYNAPLSVGIGATLALWAVAGIAGASGQTLLRFVNITTTARSPRSCWPLLRPTPPTLHCGSAGHLPPRDVSVIDAPAKLGAAEPSRQRLLQHLTGRPTWWAASCHPPPHRLRMVRARRPGAALGVAERRRRATSSTPRCLDRALSGPGGRSTFGVDA